MNPIAIYLLIINALGFVLMLTDKLKAKRNLWRIPEVTLLGCALLGGSLGVLGGMYAFRHKTLHLKFRLGVPIIMALQVVLTVLLYARYK